MPVNLADMIEELPPEHRAAIEREAQNLVTQNRTLAELRKMLHITQADLAKALETSQANVAQIEAKKDVMVSTLIRIVEALGGGLQIVVTIPGHEAISLRVGERNGDPVLLKAAARKRRTTAVAVPSSGGRELRKRA